MADRGATAAQHATNLYERMKKDKRFGEEHLLMVALAIAAIEDPESKPSDRLAAGTSIAKLFGLYGESKAPTEADKARERPSSALLGSLGIFKEMGGAGESGVQES